MKNSKTFVIPGLSAIADSTSSGWLIFAVIFGGSIFMGILDHGWWEAWQFHVIIWPTLVITLFLAVRVLWRDYKVAPQLSAIGPLLAIIMAIGFLIAFSYGLMWLVTGGPGRMVSDLTLLWKAYRASLLMVAVVTVTVFVNIKIWRPTRKVVTP